MNIFSAFVPDINKFVAQAVETVNGFVDMDIVKQKAAIVKMAELQMTEQVANIIPAEEVPVDA